MIRVAAVSYFNARPLVEGLRSQEDFEVRDLPPAEAAEALLSGDADVGLVPCVTLLKDPRLTYLPGLCIGAHGAVDSVLLYLKTGALESGQGKIRIALDPHSRTSQMLTKIYLVSFLGYPWERFEFVEESPKALLEDEERADQFDGILVIGDLALLRVPRGPWDCIDLSLAWTEATGLPFVFAVWGVRQETLTRHPDLSNKFLAALDTGMEEIESIVRELASGFGLKDSLAKHYLTERIVFRMDDQSERGLNEFLNRCRSWENLADA